MKKQFFKLNINSISFKDTIDEIVENAIKNISSYLCAVNVHMTVEAQKDELLKSAINASTWAVTDGMPVAWAYGKIFKTNQERVAGMDITPELLSKANKHGLIVSVYGNTELNLDKFKAYLTKHYPNLKIGCLVSPPYRELSAIELNHNIEKINNVKSQIIFISLGCPKQEKWMFENSKRINGVCLGVGNAINTTIGQEKRPPKFVQSLGMEWFYRLIQNPRRLFKRYFYTNTQFCILIIKKALNFQQS